VKDLWLQMNFRYSDRIFCRYFLEIALEITIEVGTFGLFLSIAIAILQPECIFFVEKLIEWKLFHLELRKPN
jgi:hypothetical protein